MILPLVGLLYVAVLIRDFHESERRTLHLREQGVGDYLSVNIKVVEADINNSEVRVHISFRPSGSLAKSGLTPARNLRLFLNGFRGPQQIDFPAGEPINPFDFELSLDGNSNLYPFDRHQTTLLLQVTTPSHHDRLPTPAATLMPEDSATKESPSKQGKHSKTGRSIHEQTASDTKAAIPAQTAPQSSEPVASDATLEHEDVPIFIDLGASIPGVKFAGRISRTQGEPVTAIDLYMSRADHVIAASIFVMLVMMCLAVSLLGMVLRATGAKNQSTLLPLSLSVSLIFGLPALRNNVQPGVPPVGVLGDYVSFVWAELIVAFSTVIVVWTWILKSEDRN